MSAATSSRSSATSSRSRSRRPASASARTCRPAPSSPPRSACWMRWSAQASSPATRESFRKKLRAGELNDKEIEIETQSAAAACRCSKSRHARRPDGRDLDRRHLRQDGRTQQDPPPDGRRLARDPRQRGIRQAARHRPAGAGSDQRGREQRHRVPRRDRQDLRARRTASAATSRAKACSAICCR